MKLSISPVCTGTVLNVESGKICEHDSQGRLIIIFLPGGAHAQADTAGPMFDAGTLPECIQYNVELWYEGIGGVDKTEVR